MKSPPLVVCVAGSLFGGCVSAAICSGPGSVALSLGCGGAGIAFAAVGAASAAAPATLAPLRKLRRATSGELLRRFMGSSERLHPGDCIRAKTARRTFDLLAPSLAPRRRAVKAAFGTASE